MAMRRASEIVLFPRREVGGRVATLIYGITDGRKEGENGRMRNVISQLYKRCGSDILAVLLLSRETIVATR